MREPAFWWRTPGMASALLQPAAWCYGAIAGRRMRKDGARAGIPVICIGNVTLGGTGKTPAAISVAELLKERGETPFFLSRGYGGRLPGPVRVDPHMHKAIDVGDEPLLLARTAPAIVARDRIAGAKLAREQGASVIVMDDGLQNPSLSKDLSVAVIDGIRGIGNARVFPAGPLRAPLGTQSERIDAILMVGGDGPPPKPFEGGRISPVLRAQLVPDPFAVKDLAGRKVFAFAGIGRPEKFYESLRAAGIEVVDKQSFPDHHRYSDADARSLLAGADAAHLTLVTTEKDMVRLTDGDRATLAARARAFPVTLQFANVDVVRRLLEEALAKGRRNPSAAP